MSKRYLEIDSTYRNRKEFPNPSNFTVLISQSGTRDAIHALDPVSNAAPLITWVPDDLVLTDVTIDVNDLNTKNKFIVSVPTNSASKINGYYVGYPIKITGTDVKITEWCFLSSNVTRDFFIVTVNPSLSNIPNNTVTFLTNVNNFENGYMFIPDGYMADHYYINFIMYNDTKKEWRPIISYDGIYELAGLDLSYGAILSWKNTDKYSIRKTHPQYIGVLPSQTQTISNTFSVSNDIIVSIGDFIRFTQTGINCRVVKIDKTLYKVTVDCTVDILEGLEIEILQFTNDNAVPFSYSGSTISQQEMVCYELELINLILPNKTLKSGGKIAFYPYVYVELQNVSSSSSGTNSVFYSNNPHTKNMLFRAAINDTRDPFISPYIKIDGGKMTQTIKFKPNDNFKFGVYLPNGEPFETVDTDLFSPVPSDPILQVNALFSMRRL